MEIDDPSVAIGDILSLNDQEVRIVGVVKDYYYYGTVEKIRPFILRFEESQSNIMAIRISNNQDSKAVEVIESNWKINFPEYLFRYNFLENILRSQNKMFTNLLRVFLIASVYGLAYFMTTHRLREIVIRKIFGAGALQIMGKFNFEYFVLIIIAFIISAPISSYIGNRLLDEFPEKYQQGAGIFLIALLVSLLTVALTVGFKLYQAIQTNPSIVLKHE